MALFKREVLEMVPEEHEDYVRRFLEYTEARSDEAHGLGILQHQINEGLSLHESSLVQDGNRFDNAGLVGVISAKRCVEYLCASLADKSIDYVVCEQSAHAGAMGFHLREIARQGYVAIGFQSTQPVMATTNIAERLVGNNLIGLALPGLNGASLSFDTSLGVCSVRQAMAADSSAALAGKVLVGQGQFAKDVSEANLLGALVPLGGHKGVGLAIAIQFLLVLLTGQPMPPRPTQLTDHGNNPFVFIGLRVSEEAVAFLSDQLALFRQQQPSVYVPGARYD